MYTASDLRKGLKIQIDGEPYIVTEFDFSKPGKGQALYRTKMRNMITGVQFTQTYRSNDKFDRPNLEERTMQFLYSQEDEFHFMDTASYEQIFLTREQLGDHLNFLVDNMEVQVLFFGDRPIDVSLPTFMLTHWCRDRTRGPRLELEEVVRQQTSATAQAVGFRDRGIVAPGYLADLNLIDFPNLQLGRPWMAHDLPTGARRLMQGATGYVATVKSGVPIFERGEATDALPGRLVRGAQPAPKGMNG